MIIHQYYIDIKYRYIFNIDSHSLYIHLRIPYKLLSSSQIYHNSI